MKVEIRVGFNFDECTVFEDKTSKVLYKGSWSEAPSWVKDIWWGRVGKLLDKEHDPHSHVMWMTFEVSDEFIREHVRANQKKKKLRVVWEVVPEDKTAEDVIPKGFIRVKNDGWLRRALGLWNKRKESYTFYWNPKTKETLVWYVRLHMGRWIVRLGRVVRA